MPKYRMSTLIAQRGTAVQSATYPGTKRTACSKDGRTALRIRTFDLCVPAPLFGFTPEDDTFKITRELEPP